MDAKYKEPQKVKNYDFAKFTSGISDIEAAAKKALKKNRGQYATATASNDIYDIGGETDPIQTDTSDSKFLFDNEDAIVINFKKHKQ